MHTLAPAFKKAVQDAYYEFQNKSEFAVTDFHNNAKMLSSKWQDADPDSKEAGALLTELQ